MKILYVVNDPAFLMSHRWSTVQAARDLGASVAVAGPQGERSEIITSRGIMYHEVSLSRWGTSLRDEFGAMRSLGRLYQAIRPDLVHHITMKPVVYGTLAARWVGNIAVVNAVSGLGYTFLSRGFFAQLRRTVVRAAVFAGSRMERVRYIFQNEDDLRDLGDMSGVPRERTVIIRGSGVDLQKIQPEPEGEGAPIVLMPSRLLRDKGVAEFVNAAGILRRRGVKARFVIAGGYADGNPAAIPPEVGCEWVSAGDVEMPGHLGNIGSLMGAAAVVCLPSYREGLPRALIEGAAFGKPLIATDVAGCREIVREGVNGLLVPPRSHQALAEAIYTMLSDRELRLRFGAASRYHVESGGFSEQHVVSSTMQIYRDLLGDSISTEKRVSPPEAIGW